MPMFPNMPADGTVNLVDTSLPATVKPRWISIEGRGVYEFCLNGEEPTDWITMPDGRSAPVRKLD